VTATRRPSTNSSRESGSGVSVKNSDTIPAMDTQEKQTPPRQHGTFFLLLETVLGHQRHEYDFTIVIDQLEE
jgi:hypothetical protein